MKLQSYRCDDFSHWLRPSSIIDRKLSQGKNFVNAFVLIMEYILSKNNYMSISPSLSKVMVCPP